MPRYDDSSSNNNGDADPSDVDYQHLECRYGCKGFGKNLQCPPNGRDDLETERLLSSYKWAILLEGASPGRQFHQLLLGLEKKAFLSGSVKTVVRY